MQFLVRSNTPSDACSTEEDTPYADLHDFVNRWNFVPPEVRAARSGYPLSS